MPRTPREELPRRPAEAGRSGAEQLSALLAGLSEDPDVAETAEYVRWLASKAQVEAEIKGIRALARTLPHEFGQPLTELLGYAELLRTGHYSPAEQDELLRYIERAATRLGQIMHAVARLADERLGEPRRYERGGRELIDLQLPTPAAEPDAVPSPSIAELRASAAERLSQPG